MEREIRCFVCVLTLEYGLCPVVCWFKRKNINRIITIITVTVTVTATVTTMMIMMMIIITITVTTTMTAIF